MKTIIKNFLKLSIFAATLFIGASAFAASFDPQPMGNHGFTTINNCDYAGCANVKNTVSYNELGNNKEFTVFINFRNNSAGTIFAARGHVTPSASSGQGGSVTFQGRLSSTNTPQITDTALLTNLPSNWQIQYVRGEVYVDDRVGNQGTLCSVAFPELGIPWSNTVSNPGNVYIRDLTYGQHLGWCEQGYIEATYKVVDTTPNPTHGQCVNYPGTYSQQPGYNTVTGCVLGTYNDIGDTPTHWQWQCVGQNGGTTATCQAAKTQQQQPVNGMCGSAHGQTYSTPPTQGLCNAGNPTQVQTNQTTYNWDCLGQNGGSTMSCWAHRQQGQQYTYSWLEGTWAPEPCTPGQQQTRIVQCLRSDGQIVPDSACLLSIGPKPPTSQMCQTSNNLSLMTQNATNIFATTNNTFNARLNGTVTGGMANYIYFVYGPNNSNLTCSSFPQVVAVQGQTLQAGENFFYNLSGLAPNTTYHFKACGQYNNGPIADGGLKQFHTTVVNEQHPEAQTQTAQNVTQNSATLRGHVAMNGFNNGQVFFVWGQNSSQVHSVSNYDTYNSIPQNGQNLQKQMVQSGFNGSSNFDAYVSGLNTNNQYHFRICVEYWDNGNRLECGNVRPFSTGGSSGNNVTIVTDPVQNVTQTTATLCGNLLNDGGSQQLTWIEFRTSSGNWVSTPTNQRWAGSWCQSVSNLIPSTSYVYRACTNHGCASTRTFNTLGSIETGIPPVIITNDPSNIVSNNATLSGTYVTNANSGTCWFEYGRTAGLGNQTRTYTVGAGYGTCVHNFTNLAAGTQYCVRAVINTVNGTDRGAIKCFNTPTVISIPGTSTPRPVIVVAQPDTTQIDLASLGLGLSLLRLDIDDNQDIVFHNSQVTYNVRWENISMIDLDDIDIKINLPSEIQVTNISRGRFDPSQNAVFYNIQELNAGESGEMFVSGIVGRGTVGNLVTAEAEAAYDNPVNRAQENAKDFDINEYGVQFAGVTASVFGLANVTFLGWLVILLGLFIIFLVARYLYLEREELRAQSYVNGYGPGSYAPTSHAGDEYYEPYRPNRG